MNVTDLIKLLRPHQWIKNAFIFLPVFFSGQFLDFFLIESCFIAFFAFSFAASSIYCFNDIIDKKIDKEHPTKYKRPIASGKISVRWAYLIMVISLSISVIIILFFGNDSKFLVLSLILVYFVLNIAYTLLLKKIPIIDVMIISIGFVLRIIVGGVVTNIELSEWIIIMTFLLALFLAFAKRRDDVVLYEETGITLRKNTNRYNLPFMNLILAVIAAVTIIAYIMYTLSPTVIQHFNSQYVYFTSFFVIAGIIKYLQITIVDSNSGNPTKIVYKDYFMQFCILGWIITFLIIIYF
jgi:4-hydroxybenzoate polyprenyltransferase